MAGIPPSFAKPRITAVYGCAGGAGKSSSCAVRGCSVLRDTHPRLAQAAGPLQEYLDDRTVIEVRVTSAGAVFVVRFGLGKERVADCPATTLDAFLALVADMV